MRINVIAKGSADSRSRGHELDFKVGAWKSHASATKMLKGFFCGPSIDKKIHSFKLRIKTMRVYGSRISSFFVCVGRYTLQMHMYCTRYEIFCRLSVKSP